MPAASTFLDICTDALQKIGQAGMGQGISAEMAQQALRQANRMLGKWAIIKLMLYVINNRPFDLSATVQDYTVGPSGAATFNQTRPNFVESGQAIIPGSSMQNPLNILSKMQWDALPDRGVVCGTNGVPASIYVEYGYPVLTLHVSPIPSTALRILLGTWENIQQFDSVADAISMPPGYEEAFTDNLAVELCAFYDMQVPPTLDRSAQEGLAFIRANNAQKLGGALGESQTLVSPNTGIPPQAGA